VKHVDDTVLCNTSNLR